MSNKIHLKIRIAVPQDINNIAHVFSRSVRVLCNKEYDKEIIEKWVLSKPPESRIEFVNRQSLWVAQVDDKIVGYTIAVKGEIIALFVLPSHVNKGIGKTLLKHAIGIASQNNLEVKLESTITAKSFYEKLGFKEISLGYYTHGGLDISIPIVNMQLF